MSFLFLYYTHYSLRFNFLLNTRERRFYVTLCYFLIIYLSPKIAQTTSVHSFVNFTGYLLLPIFPFYYFYSILYLLLVLFVSFLRIKSIPFTKYTLLFYLLGLRYHKKKHYNFSKHWVLLSLIFFSFLLNLNLIGFFLSIDLSSRFCYLFTGNYIQSINHDFYYKDIVFWKKNNWSLLSHLNLFLKKSSLF